MQKRKDWICGYEEKLFFTNTSLLIVDPFNDFYQSGKLSSLTKENIKGVNLIENLKNILSAARSSVIKVLYVPHHLIHKGDCRLEIPDSYTYGVFLDNSLLKKGSEVENSILNSCLKAAILLCKTIGLLVALQIQTLIFAKATQYRSCGYRRYEGEHLH